MDSKAYKKILVLNNQLESSLMQEILADQNIPHQIKPLQDQAYGNLWQQQFGWGYLFAPKSYAQRIQQIYNDLLNAPIITPPEDGPKPLSSPDN